MQKLLRFFTSMRLAIALIALLAAGSALATAIPQGLGEADYLARYGRLLGAVLVQAGMDRYFGSLLFIGPAFLFFANLAACSASRFARELRKKSRRRHGADILHFGLMLLVVGSVLSFSGRREGSVRLAPGESAELPDGRILRLERFEYLSYEDGRPRDWISSVSVLKDGEAQIEGYALRVNHPLKLGKLSLYQASHSAEAALLVRDAAGKESLLARGQELESGGSRLFLMTPDDGAGKAVFRLEGPEGSGAPRVLRAAPGESAGPFALLAIRSLERSGIQAVADPGYALVVAALLVICAGTFLAFIQKLGDTKP
ncbi:MAG TPA: cytochrome c biogenesis protein ResB [Spirochaetales bacterium]|nr:cytochrome c biogenesis protein ResB [Spirochaetales bacterium]HRY53637.1 cytochrome c biogenesis protein ResB [Spirochaetia bacterium]HRZ63732.1 cytochrome c biogenesis protein ResB [Spirochaetia bacterium]